MAVAKSIQRSCCLHHKMMHPGYRDSFVVAIVVIVVVLKYNVSLSRRTIPLRDGDYIFEGVGQVGNYLKKVPAQEKVQK